MSRIGKMPVSVPAGVDVKIDGTNHMTVKGPKGTLERTLHKDMILKIEKNGSDQNHTEVTVSRPSDQKIHKSLHGLTRTLINNMVVGVSQGYEKALEINGVGYRAQKQGKELNLSLGYSHPVLFKEPEGITIDVPAQTSIIVKGIDKQLVGEVAAKIRGFRKPEPYKGKGIKYINEHIRRKEGKTGKKA